MTSPLSPEAVAQMVADREAGTPGPWRFDGPVWNQIVWTDGDNRLCFMAHSNGLNDDRDIANASRITRLPDLEAAYLTLAAENATLRAENEELDFLRHEGGPDSVAAMEIELATLRASEAAAWARVTTALEITQTRHIPDQPAAYGGSELEWAQRQYASLRRDIIAAITPTADEEPKP